MGWSRKLPWLVILGMLKTRAAKAPRPPPSSEKEGGVPEVCGLAWEVGRSQGFDVKAFVDLGALRRAIMPLIGKSLPQQCKIDQFVEVPHQSQQQ